MRQPAATQRRYSAGLRRSQEMRTTPAGRHHRPVRDTRAVIGNPVDETVARGAKFFGGHRRVAYLDRAVVEGGRTIVAARLNNRWLRGLAGGAGADLFGRSVGARRG